MKKLLLLTAICLTAGQIYASEFKPAVARIASYLEGIVELKVKQGQQVKKGQLLFTVSTEYTEIVKEKCKNGVWFYQQEYDRIKKLAATHSKSIDDLQLAEKNLADAKGSLDIENLLIDKWSKYYAPFNGVVTKIYNYDGSGVSSGSGNCDRNDAVMEITKLEDYNRLKAAGNLDDQQETAYVAPMTDGLLDVKVSQGQKVKKGQLLFKVDMAYNQITKKQQEAKVTYYKDNYGRTKKLYGTNTESLKTYQTAQYDMINAIQDLKGTNLIINERSKYSAPFNGTVSEIIHYSGSNIFTGHTVLKVTKD